MTQERRYKMYCMNNKEYILDEDDMEKLNANSDKMLVKLKQVIVHPSSVTAIEPFFVPYIQKVLTQPNENNTAMVAVNAEPEAPAKLEDLFINPCTRVCKGMQCIICG